MFKPGFKAFTCIVKCHGYSIKRFLMEKTCVACKQVVISRGRHLLTSFSFFYNQNFKAIHNGVCQLVPLCEHASLQTESL